MIIGNSLLVLFLSPSLSFIEALVPLGHSHDHLSCKVRSLSLLKSTISSPDEVIESSTTRPPSSGSGSASRKFPSGSTIELADPETGCQVVLLGCFHGSQSSAADVVSCLSQQDDDDTDERTVVVALELCATRFADLRRDVLEEKKQKQQEQQKGEGQTSTRQQRPWVVRFVSMVRKTVDQRGWSTGLAAAMLGGVSGLQTSMSGLEPGLEFRTALLQVMENGNKHVDVDDNDAHDSTNQSIVLADQNVDETLDQIGQLPAVAVNMWKEFLTGKSWQETFGTEAKALARAVGLVNSNSNDDGGNDVEYNTVSLLGFVTRSPYALRDMARLLVPPVLLMQATVLAINGGFEWLHAQPEWIEAAGAAEVAATTTMTTTTTATATATTVASDAIAGLTNYVILLGAYVSMALPAVKVILRERDHVLATNIQQACRLATDQGARPGRVVAVLGLLHVNGVAQRISSTTDKQKKQQEE